MATTQQTLGALLPIGGNIVKWMADRRASKNALGLTTAGVDSAGRDIDAATKAANDRANAALARNRTDYGTLGERTRADYGTLGEQQRALYDTTAANNRGAQDLGNLSIEQLQEMIRNPEKFDPSSVATEPGYQFGLNEGLKGKDHAAQARGSLGNGGQAKAQTRYALDYATTKYDEAVTRFRNSQTDKQNLYTSGATIGQNANNAVQAAGNTLGAQMSANTGAVAAQDAMSTNALANQTESTAHNTGQNTIRGAEDKAGLTLAQAEAAAQNEINQGANNSSLVGSLIDAAPAVLGLFTKAAGTTAGGTAALTSMSAAFKSAMTILTKNPYTLPIAGALAAGAVWLKSQAHWEANTGVKDFENPFAQESLAPFAAQWDAAIKEGTMTADAGNQALEAYQENFEEYTRKITEWAGNSSDKKKVSQQSIKNLWDKVIKVQIERMTREIAGMPTATAEV